jgi:hypothetical protein
LAIIDVYPFGRRTVMPAEGVEPTRPCDQRIFLPLRLSPPSSKSALRRLRRGSGSGLSLHRAPDNPASLKLRRTSQEFRCCPSSLYTFPEFTSGLGSGLPFEVSRRRQHGVSPLVKVSPNLSSSASPVSQRALKFCLSPPRLPFRHAGMVGNQQLRIIKQAVGICTSVSVI